MLEVIGIDHIYITVSDFEKSETFYDAVFTALGFRKNAFQVDGDRHIQYYNRHFGYVLRPARSMQAHDAFAPGLHHLCMRVESESEVEQAYERLKELDIPLDAPKHYPEYAEDYVALFFSDPDGLQLEITNYRRERRERHDNWD